MQLTCALPSTKKVFKKFKSNHLIIHNFYITYILRQLEKEFYTGEFLKKLFWRTHADGISLEQQSVPG